MGATSEIYFQGGGSSRFFAGKSLTDSVRAALSLPTYEWGLPGIIESKNGYTAAQKIMGSKAGVEGVAPGSFAEFAVDLVASQDTTGTITRLASRILCAVQWAVVTLQTLCHTSAYPKKSDLVNFQTLPEFFTERGGIGLKRGDGVIHTWLKKLSTLGWLIIGGDSHTRNVLGVAIPGDSLLVAFAAAFGFIPYTMPQSVRIQFNGDWSKFAPRDLQLMIVEKLTEMGLMDQYNKTNILKGKIVEIYGLDEMSLEDKFVLMNAMGEYGPVAQWIFTPLEIAMREVQGFVDFWQDLVGTDRGDTGINWLIQSLEVWLSNPVNPIEDAGAEYAHSIEIDLESSDTEPLVTAYGITESGALGSSYNRVVRLSELPNIVPARHLLVNQAAIMSCTAQLTDYEDSMDLIEAYLLDGRTIGGDCIWYAPSSVMIENALRKQGRIDRMHRIFEDAGLSLWDYSTSNLEDRHASNGRIEMPGCSLCMGNQDTLQEGVVWGNFTRNNKGRVGPAGKVFAFMADPLLDTSAFLLGHAPSVAEYEEHKQLLADFRAMS